MLKLWFEIFVCLLLRFLKRRQDFFALVELVHFQLFIMVICCEFQPALDLYREPFDFQRLLFWLLASPSEVENIFRHTPCTLLLRKNAEVFDSKHHAQLEEASISSLHANDADVGRGSGKMLLHC